MPTPTPLEQRTHAVILEIGQSISSMFARLSAITEASQVSLPKSPLTNTGCDGPRLINDLGHTDIPNCPNKGIVYVNSLTSTADGITLEVEKRGTRFPLKKRFESVLGEVVV